MPHFRIAVKKSFGGDTKNATWVNDYVIQTDALIGSPEMAAIAGNFVTFEKAFHQQAAKFISVSITDLDGPNHGTPQGNRVVAAGGQGSLSQVDPADENGVFYKAVTMFVKLAALSGKAGSKSYRGALSERYVRWDSGTGTILQTVVDAFDNAYTALVAALGQSKLAIENKKGKNRVGFSLVASASVIGVRNRQADRRKKKGEVPTSANGLFDLNGEILEGIGTFLAGLTFAKAKGTIGQFLAKAPAAATDWTGAIAELEEIGAILAAAAV